MSTSKLFKVLTFFWWLTVLLVVSYWGAMLFSFFFGTVGESIAGIAIALLIMCPFAFVNETHPLLENLKNAVLIGVLFFFGVLSMLVIGWFAKVMIGFSANALLTILVGFGVLTVLDVIIIFMVWVARKIYKLFKKNN